jgi:hypothetical protein
MTRIRPEQFYPEIELYKESLVQNTFYHGKLLIDTEFTNYSDITFTKKTSASDNAFLSNVRKDEVDVCRQCEFRYMCIDSSIILKRKNGTFYRENPCEYNPFIAKWVYEKDYYSLEECGVLCNTQGFEIDHSGLNQIINSLYEI